MKGIFMFFNGDPKKLLHNVKMLSAKFFTKSKVFSHLQGNCDCLGPVCIACSGGSDSVFLTLVFCAYFEKFECLAKNASILHLNHNLRGEESLQDAKFVEKFAKFLGLNFISGTLNKCSDKSSEAELRSVRYGFFSKQMRAIGSNTLLLGHQQNDVAETLIMRLTRASGLDGLSAPREIQLVDGMVRLRPLLGIKKNEIEAILRQCGTEWRVDSSNASCNYFRNIVRNVALKELQKAVPQYDVIANIAASHVEIVEANGSIQEIADSTIESMVNCGSFHDLEITEVVGPTIKRFILHRWLLHRHIELKKSEFEKLLSAVVDHRDIQVNALHGEKLISLEGKLMAATDLEIKEKIRASFKFENWMKGLLTLPDGKTLSRELRKIEGNDALLSCDFHKQAYVELQGNESLSVMDFNPNLSYVRFGHKSPRRLREILGRETKNCFGKPMVLRGDTVCWVPGLPVSDLFKIKENVDQALLLTYS